jgi:hypothetical protein
MGILNQTLGELLQTNPQAQKMIMKAMQVTPEQFQQMLSSTNTNPVMNQTIGELFQNGTMQQAASEQQVQVTPEQMQQVVSALSTNQSTQTAQKPTFLQKLKNLFG